MFSLMEVAAFGQAAAINAELTGTVVDPSGEPVATAKVSVINTGTDYQQSTTTTSAGLYRLPVLPIGEYSLTIQANGFATYKQTGIRLSAGSTAVDVKLQL